MPTVRFRDVWVGAVLTGLAVARRARRFFAVRARPASLQRARIDRRGRRVPGVGVHLRGDPAVWRRSDRRLRASPPSPARRDSRRAGAADDTVTLQVSGFQRTQVHETACDLRISLETENRKTELSCTWRGRECFSTLPAARQANVGRADAPAEHRSGWPGR